MLASKSLAKTEEELYLDMIREEANKELARRSYRDYVEYAHFGLYKHFPHTDLICEHLQPIADGEQKFIIIEMPPRHGKSMTTTETFPSYYVMKNPTKRVITVSYADTLARKFGRKNRDKVKLVGQKLFNVNISPLVSKANDWELENSGGGMISVGITGGATGHGADLLVIDDPFKNREEAESLLMRDKVFEEWESTFLTRLHGGGSIIIIMTRWHEDDLIGRLLKKSNFKWERLRLPAVAEDENDLLQREVGEPLCPGLGYDKKWADDKKIQVGSRTWASLYQQRPSPADGNIFKRHWFRYYVPNEEFRRKYDLGDEVKVLPRLFDKSVQSWDCTFKDTKKSDFVAGHVWNRKQGEFFMLDREHDRMNLPATISAIRRLSTKWPDAIAKYIEDKANGPAVMQMLKGELTGMIPVEPDGGKEARANAVSPLFEAGNVYLPHPLYKPWVEEVIEELVSFPNGQHDDDVDAATQALNKLRIGKKSLLDRYRDLM